MQKTSNPIIRMSAALAALLLVFSGQSSAFGQGASLTNGATMTILGTGTGALLRSPLTDPENDGNEVAGPLDPSWNWISISSNSEQGFNAVPFGTGTPANAGTERSFNVFDHLVGGGDNKWCCGEPIANGATLATSPLVITVELNDSYRLTHFTVTSGNDTPERDPRNWRILGSTNGTTFEPIFVQQSLPTDTVSVWTARDQVIRFDLETPSKAYKFIRFECSATFLTGTGAFYQLNEIEYFGFAAEEVMLGTGVAALLKSDKTDPENDGSIAAGPTSPTWNWKAITSSEKPSFSNNGAFSVFDNLLSSTNKWSGADPTVAAPQHVTVEFTNALVVTRFTITSADDAPENDPIKFQLLGSTDGVTFTPFYTKDDTVSPWGLRNQVLRVALREPTPAYKFIRYQVTETAGPGHQLGEIELFGSFGGLGNPVISAVGITPTVVFVRVNDGADTFLDTNSVRLTVDGAAVTPVITKSGTNTIVAYNRSPVFASASAHTYAFTAVDNLGNIISRSGSLTTPTYTAINAAIAVPTVDTNTPGFKLKVHQMEFHKGPGLTPQGNGERQISLGYYDTASGTPVNNIADLSLAGPDGYFVEPETINYNQTAPTAAGIFSSNATAPTENRVDRRMPGVTGADPDRFAISIETYLELKAGFYRIGFVTDDGNRFSFGRAPGDVLGTQLNSSSGTFNGTVDVVIPMDGYYPIRLMWFENTGGAAAELYITDLVTGERVLVNDLSVPTAVRAFRESPVARPHVSRVLPTTNYGFAFADEDVIVEITDGAVAVDPSSFRMLINSNLVTLNTPGKTGAVTQVRRVGGVANLLPPGPNNVSFIYGFTQGGSNTLVTNTYAFTVPAYTRPIPPNNRVSASEVTGSGFRVFVHQIDKSRDTNQGNGGRVSGANMPGPEIVLYNGYISLTNNVPYPNLANTNDFGADGTKELFGLLNFNAGQQLNPALPITTVTGVFIEDQVLPGLPGLGTSPAPPAAPGGGTIAQGNDNSVHEYTMYLDLKAGAYLFGINVDDGWVCWSSPNAKDTLGTLLGYKNGPGGQVQYPMTVAAGIFNVIVVEDGIYPVRILAAQGGGGNNIEFMTIDRGTGNFVLVNDLLGQQPTTAGGPVTSPIQSYSTYTGPVRPWTKFSMYPFPHIGTATPLVTAGNAGPTLWQNRDQQSGPGQIFVKTGLINGSWNPGEIQNSATAQRPFGDAVGAVVADLGNGTVGMILDGVNVTPTVTVIPNSTDKLVLYTPPTLLSSASNHVAGLIYAGTTNYWVFNVITNVVLDASNRVAAATVDTNAPGFRIKVAQATAPRGSGNTTVAAAELQLAGTPASVTPAGPAAGGTYIHNGIINFNVTKGITNATEIGNFQPLMGGPNDLPFPGLPGTGLTGNARMENFTAEITAFLDLPAGYQKFGINGDDGFRVQIGTPGNTNGPILFTIDRSGGASDFPFAFVTPEAGLYPIRIVYYQGGGGGNLEFFTYGPNNTKVPVNSANGIKAYVSAAGVPQGPQVAVSRSGNNITITWTGGGTLFSATSVAGPWTTTNDSDGSFTEAIGATGNKYYMVR